VKIRDKQGFTLMEVLIVVAIIAVLVAIAIPVYKGLVEKARAAADATILRNAQTAFVVQELTTGKKPPKRAYYDIVSNTFIEWDVYNKAENKFKKYFYYGQARNNKGAANTGNQHSHSWGTNAHVMVDFWAIENFGPDYGPEAVVWWAENKNDHPERWGD
jgi:prepilin-type N-terminal cleavage/methylation domain-containing protein